MMEKQASSSGDQPELLQPTTASSDSAGSSEADVMLQLCQTLLAANTLKDVLAASLSIVSPTEISGLTILLCAGPDTDRYLEVGASWEHNGQLALPNNIQFSLQDYLFQSLSINGDAIVVNNLTSDKRVSEYTRSVLLHAGIRALVMLPLDSADNRFGALLICRSDNTPFDPKSLREFETVARLATGVIEKLWLIRTSERALAKTSALYEISQRLSTAQCADDVLRYVISSDLFGAAGGTIAVLDRPTATSDLADQELVFQAAVGMGAQHILGMRMPVTEGVVGWVIRENEPALVPDAYADERFYRQMDQEIDFRTQSILCAPLRIDNRVLGAFELVDVRPEYLGEEGIRLLSQLADQSALLIENQRLLDENRRLLSQTNDALQETTMLYQASRALTQSQDLNEVLHAITDNLPIDEVNQCWIALIVPGSGDHDPANRVTEIMAIWDHRNDHSLLGTRFTSRELPVFARAGEGEGYAVFDVKHETDLDTQSARTLQSLGINFVLIAPLRTAESLLGWLVLVTHHDPHSFGEDQIRSYQTLADQAAVAIRSQRLLQQVQDSLEEVETVHGQYLRREWTSYLQSKDNRLSTVVYDRGAVLTSDDICNPLIEQAVDQGTLVTNSSLVDNDGRNGADGPAESLHRFESGSSLVAPLKVRDQVIGTLGLEDPEHVREWTEDEISVVQEVAERVAQAVENARLLEETQTSLAETERLYQATGRLSDAASAKDVLKTLAGEYRDVLGPAYSGSILLAGPDPSDHVEWLELSVQWNPEEETVVAGTRFAMADHAALSRLLGQSEPVIISDATLHGGESAPHKLLDLPQPHPVLVIPLIAGESRLGVINIVSHENGTPDASTLRFLQNLADRAAVALESARLYTETQRRAIQLEAGAKVSRAATSILQQDKLLSSVVALIRDHFAYYHAQVYLLDPAERWAILEASTGETGQKLLSRGHALEVGGDSLVGKATFTAQPKYADNRNDGQLSRENRELAETRSQLAIPLRIGGRVIGALDVHSKEASAFGPDDIAVLSTLADQLAVAIENARLYQEQLETAKKLREVDRLKTQFLANMSHELRTPLNSIIGFSRVILKGIDGPLTDLQEQDLTAIFNSGKLLLRLINDVLDISKIAAGKMELAFEELDLHEIIKSAMSTTTALVKDTPQVELRQQIPTDLPPIIADATRLRQVLLNLLSNAVKFTEEGAIELNVTHDSNFVTIQVSDTGIGIPPDKFDLIFQEFEQVDGTATRAVGGTGLGLPISRHFVELHGGRIWVESKVGAGSTFTVQLPVRGPDSVPEAGDEITIDASRRLVLAIDDDGDNVRFYRRFLQQQKYQVIGVSDSVDAAEKARTLHPYAILLDVLMPNKDGWTVIQELKSHPDTRDIPVIMCSIVNAAGRGFSLGAADFLVRPFTEERLLAAMARLEDGERRGPNEPRRVVIIDDTPEDRKLLRRTLESADEPYHVIEASGGFEGVKAIKDQKPDLVVLDLMMPEMDGFAVLESLKRDSEMREIPIIIVTAKELTEIERAQINGRVAALYQKGLFEEDEFIQDLSLALHRLSHTTQRQKET
jgi:signal transduction histidine kinase/DNA-binding response OmpR family regulator